MVAMLDSILLPLRGERLGDPSADWWSEDADSLDWVLTFLFCASVLKYINSNCLYTVQYQVTLIAPDKVLFYILKVLMFFLFLQENML